MFASNSAKTCRSFKVVSYNLTLNFAFKFKDNDIENRCTFYLNTKVVSFVQGRLEGGIDSRSESV